MQLWRASWATLVLLCTSVSVAAESIGEVHVSPDGRFLARADGSPFFWLADTGWTLFHRLDRKSAEQYLSQRAAQGYNVIQAVAFGGPADPLTAPNRYGHLPLIDGDLDRPNPEYFEHVDWVVDRAAEKGLHIAMLPVWGASLIGGWVVNAPAELFTPAKAEAYGRWLARRYQGKGVIWILGGDASPVGIVRFSLDPQERDMTLVDHRPIYDAIARGLTQGQAATPLISYHMACCTWLGTAPPRTSQYFGDRDWLSLNMLQSSHFRNPDVLRHQLRVPRLFVWDGRYNYEAVRAEYDSMPIRPVIDGEPRYEDLAVDVESKPARIQEKGYWSAYDARNAAYHAVFAGAAGHTYGNHSVWQFYDQEHYPPLQAARKELPWQKAVLQPGAAQMRHLKALMLSRPYFTRIPDQSILVGSAGEAEEHVSATRDRAGSYAMVYIPNGQRVTLDLSLITGLTAVAWWYDPRTGFATRIPNNFRTSGATAFVPPSGGPEADWVLVVDDESRRFDAPGALENSQVSQLQ